MNRPWSWLVPFFAAAVLLLCGWLGGAGNSADMTVIAEAAQLRVSSAALTDAAIAVTQLGNAYVLLPVSLIVALLLVYANKRRTALLFSLSVVGERLLLDGIKILVHRPRPHVGEAPVLTHSFSFPSGHAANSITVLLAIALFALPERHRRWSMPVALALGAVISATRPLLGVHWPSDVIGGWMLGVLSIALAYWARDRFALRDRPSGTAA